MRLSNDDIDALVEAGTAGMYPRALHRRAVELDGPTEPTPGVVVARPHEPAGPTPFSFLLGLERRECPLVRLPVSCGHRAPRRPGCP